MKIAYIGKFAKLWDEEAIALGLEEAGATVERIEESGMYNEVLTRIEAFNPDVVLGAKYNVFWQKKFFQWLKTKPYISASWTFDLLIGHPPRESRVRSYRFLYCDVVFLTDGGHMKEYKDIGVNVRLLRQGIPDEFCYMAEPEEGPDIVFVGTENPTFPYRQNLMRLLKHEYGSRFTWIGQNNAEACRGHDLNKLYASAKIVVGDCMYGDYYWSNRIVETLGRGGFLIHPNVRGIEKDYKPYKEFIPYNWGDFRGMVTKINYYLDHKEDRDKIRTAGFERVKNNYKMSHKCKELYETLKQYKSQQSSSVK